MRNMLVRILRFACVPVLLCTSAVSAMPVLSVGGDTFGYTGIDGISLGWSMSFGATVSISAPLANGNGAFPAIGNMAYLTQGALPDLLNVVASTAFDLPGNFDGEVLLFPSLSLGAGSYWLMFETVGPPSSYANIRAANPVQITAAPGAQFLGYYLDSIGVPVNNAFSWQFSVTEAANVPEPSSFGLCIAGCAAIAAGLATRKKN